MAIVTYPHLSVVAGGTLGTPAAEIWSCSVKMIYLGGTSDPQIIPFEDQELLVQLLTTPWVTWITSLPAKITAAATLTYVKANMIGEDGKYVYPNTSVNDFEGVPGAGAGTADWRQSVVITMRGPSSRGKASTGRFYPPTVAVEPENTSTPYFSATIATAMVGTAKTFLDDLNSIDISGTGLTENPFVALVGNADPSKPGSARVWNRVNVVEVDRVVDTQRRRTNSVARNVAALNLD